MIINELKKKLSQVFIFKKQMQLKITWSPNTLIDGSITQTRLKAIKRVEITILTKSFYHNKKKTLATAKEKYKTN